MWFLYCIYILSLIGRLVNSHTPRHQNRRNKQYREREFVDCVYSLVIILWGWRFYFDSQPSNQNKYYSYFSNTTLKYIYISNGHIQELGSKIKLQTYIFVLYAIPNWSLSPLNYLYNFVFVILLTVHICFILCVPSIIKENKCVHKKNIFPICI